MAWIQTSGKWKHYVLTHCNLLGCCNCVFICLGTSGESITFKKRTACALLFSPVLQNQRRTTAAIANRAKCIPVLLPLSTQGQRVHLQRLLHFCSSRRHITCVTTHRECKTAPPETGIWAFCRVPGPVNLKKSLTQGKRGFLKLNK